MADWRDRGVALFEDAEAHVAVLGNVGVPGARKDPDARGLEGSAARDCELEVELAAAPEASFGRDPDDE
jgi:hypothetical protein